MNKSYIKVLGLLLVVGLLFAVAPTKQAVAQTVSTWDGTYPAEKPTDMPAVSGGVQEVTTAAQFAWLSRQADMFPAGVTTVKLMVDIDLDNHLWTPSGGLASGSAAGGNIFDGNGRTISNLNAGQVLIGGFNFSALFVGANGGAPIIQNLVIDGAAVEATGFQSYAAVVVAANDFGGDFINVTVKNATVKATKYAGGISTYSSSYDGGANFTNCAVEGLTIEVQEMLKPNLTVNLPHVGGILGYMNVGTFSGNTVTGLTITILPVEGQVVATTQVGALIGTAQAGVLVGQYDVSNVIYNGAPYAKLIGLDVRTNKVVNATKMIGYTTIQAAINAATNGDTIMVFAGTYVEDVTVVNKYFTLIGEVDGSGASTSILEGTLSIDNPTVSPEFTTIKNIYFEGTDNHLLILKNLNGGLIENCVFDGNGRFMTPTVMNGISAVSSPNGQQFTVKDSLFKDGLYTGIGGYATDVTVEDSTFTNVKSGINLAGGANLTVTNVDFSVVAQGATSDTYGIRLGSDGLGSGKQLTVTNSTFAVNKNGFIATPDPVTGVHTYHSAIILRAGVDGATSTIRNSTILGELVNLSSTGVTLDATMNWWGSAAGPAAGQLHADSIAPILVCPWLGTEGGIAAPYGVTNEDTDEQFCYIQDAIDDADTLAGHTITVAAGTYEENIYVNKDISLLGPNAGISPNGVTPRVGEAIIKGAAADWVAVYVDAAGATIDGFTIDAALLGLNTYNYNAGVYGEANDLLVQNNIFSNFNDGMAILTSGGRPTYITGISVKNNKMDNTTPGTGIYNSGIYLQSSVGTVSGNVINNYRGGIQVQPYFAPGNGFVQDNYFRTYRVGMYFNYTEVDTANWLFEGNDVAGIAHPAGVTPERYNAIRVETFYEGNVDFEDNSILLGTSDAVEKYQYFENNVTNGVRDASPNWWGSSCGPTAISGVVNVSPWYADAAMTTLATGVSGSYTFPDDASTAEINATIACAAPGSTLTFDGDYPGGIIIPEDRHHLTFNLLDGATITGVTATDGYCFNVKGSYIRIEAESYAGATCIPTNGWPGIEINYMPTPWDNPLVDLVIDKLEIDGTDQSTGAGIWSAYFITDLQILNNYIHDLDAEAILLEDEPAGTFEVQGNMFLRTLGVADLTSHLINLNPYNFEYNSWGAYTVTDSITTAPDTLPVDYTPWTHVELFANWVSGSSSWQDQVMKDETIVYSIQADLQHVTGAMFDLKYDPAKLEIVEVIPTYAFDPVPLTTSVIDTSVAGVIHYDGWKLTQVSGEKVVLYTVEFKAKQFGTTDTLDFDETTDLFSMTPLVNGVPSGSSTNIYAYLLNSKIVNLPTLPVLDIEPVAGQNYVAGLPIEFNVTVTNTGGGNFDDLGLIYFDFPTDAVLEYWDGDSWEAIPATFDAGTLLTGGSFAPVLPKFRVTFVNPGDNAISVKLMDQFPTTDYELAMATETFVTLGNFTVTGTVWMQGRSWRGDVPVTLTVVSGFPSYGPRSGTSFNQISNNLEILNVNGGTYELTTLQKRYLNLYPENLKHIVVNSNELLNSLELKGGNAIWTQIEWDHDNDESTPALLVDIINVQDAGMVGTWYGLPIDSNNDADCNFDGKVNIQDLALVGGNYNLTNLAAYGIGDATWDPQP